MPALFSEAIKQIIVSLNATAEHDIIASRLRLKHHRELVAAAVALDVKSHRRTAIVMPDLPSHWRPAVLGAGSLSPADAAL